MVLPKLVVSPGTLRLSYENALENLRVSNAVGRLWSKDVSLWPGGHSRQGDGAHFLRWLDLPDTLKSFAKNAARAAAELGKEFDDVVFIAMGSSNFVAELVPSLALTTRGKRFFVLDSIHPEDIRFLESAVHLPRTLFLIVSKTGKAIETHNLFLYFFEQLKLLGIATPGRHFMAVTEDGSYLGVLAGQYKFRERLLDPEGFPGRFSGLLHFTLLFVALCHRDAPALIASATQMREACGPHSALSENPAATLAALLAAGAIEGHDRLAILTHPRLMPMAYRLGQLVGTSTCDEGQGIVPLFGANPSVIDSIRGKYIAVFLRFAGMPDAELEQAAGFIERTDVPTVIIDLEKADDLCAELYLWEIATCLACSLLERNPFKSGSEKELRELAVSHLEEMRTQRGTMGTKPRILQDGLELFVEGATRHEISMLSLEEAVRSLFSLPEADGYLALLSFLPGVNGTWEILQGIRERLEAALHMPVLLNQGPRYFYAAGQSYKKGPAKGAFLMLTGKPQEDIPVPGAEYTFGEMGAAMAMADFEALTERNRPVMRLNFRENSSPAIGQFQKLCDRARVGIRRSPE